MFGVATDMLLSLVFPEIRLPREAAGSEMCLCFELDSFCRDSPPEAFVFELLTVPVAVTIDLASLVVLPLLGRDWKLWCLLSLVLD